MRRYAKTAAMAATGRIGEGPLFLADYVLRLLRALLLIAVWRTILRGGRSIPGLPLHAVLTYTLVRHLLEPLMNVRSTIDGDLWEGTIATRFVRPLPIFGQYGAEVAGSAALDLAIFSVPLAVAAPLLGVSLRPASAASAGLFVISLGLAVSVGLAIELAFGAFMVLLEQNWYAIQLVRGAVVPLLSGAFIPLAALPWEVGRVLDWLPFASTASAPLQIYVGAGSAPRLLAAQAFWALALWPFARWMWTANRQRMVVFGG